ncbi:MAG: ABC transporter substrate-binding protein [Planctomycetota bacterium]|nr:ABC transporter substrate-binding protein [Planctomycetota bacterium]
MRKSWLLAVVPLFMVSLARSGAEPIRVGGVYPLTGDVAAIGQNIKRGIDFAVEEINAKGGVLGRPVEMIWGDTQGDPKIGMSEAERLITRSNVSCLLGAYQSAVTEVVSQVAERYRTPFLTAISTANVLTTRGYRYFFRLAPTNMAFLKSMMQFVSDYNQKELGGKLKTAAIVADNTLLGQETKEWGEYWCKELGFDVINVVLYMRGAPDLTSEVLSLKASNPDILIADNYISDCILLTKTMGEQNFRPNIVIGKATGFIDPTYIPNVGSLSNGIATALEWAPDMSNGAETNAAFRKVYNIDMNGHSANAYTATWVLKTAIEQAGAPDKEKIRQALRDITITKKFPNGPDIILPYDEIAFVDVDINGIRHTNINYNAITTVAQIQNGQYITIWPFEKTTNKVIYPAPMR